MNTFLGHFEVLEYECDVGSWKIRVEEIRS